LLAINNNNGSQACILVLEQSIEAEHELARLEQDIKYRAQTLSLLDEYKKNEEVILGELSEKIDELSFQKSALDEHAIVSITDNEGNIIYANRKFVSISKYSKSELLGQNHRILNSNFHPDSFFRQMWQTIASGRVWHGEIQNKAKDGTFYWVASTIVPMMDDNGKPKKIYLNSYRHNR
jgi:PAS domain S-box-containing protein